MAVAGIYSVGGTDQRRAGFTRTTDTSFLVGSRSLNDALAKARGSGLSSQAVKSWWSKYGQVGGGGAAPVAGETGLTSGASDAFQRAIEYYGPEGGFGAGVEAALERGRTKAVAAGGQALSSAGLANTTMMAGLGKKYEEEVAAPTRAGVESERASRLANIYTTMAGAEQSSSEAEKDRILRRDLAGGQLGLGYAQLGSAQERMYLNQAAQNRGGTSTGTTTSSRSFPTMDFPLVTPSTDEAAIATTDGNSWSALWKSLKNKVKPAIGNTLANLFTQGRASNEAGIAPTTALSDIDRTALGLSGSIGVNTPTMSYAKRAAMNWQ